MVSFTRIQMFLENRPAVSLAPECDVNYCVAVNYVSLYFHLLVKCLLVTVRVKQFL